MRILKRPFEVASDIIGMCDSHTNELKNDLIIAAMGIPEALELAKQGKQEEATKLVDKFSRICIPLSMHVLEGEDLLPVVAFAPEMEGYPNRVIFCASPEAVPNPHMWKSIVGSTDHVIMKCDDSFAVMMNLDKLDNNTWCVMIDEFSERTVFTDPTSGGYRKHLLAELADMVVDEPDLPWAIEAVLINQQMGEHKHLLDLGCWALIKVATMIENKAFDRCSSLNGQELKLSLLEFDLCDLERYDPNDYTDLVQLVALEKWMMNICDNLIHAIYNLSGLPDKDIVKWSGVAPNFPHPQSVPEVFQTTTKLYS